MSQVKFTKDDFEFAPSLGGATHVILTTHKSTGVQYATKIISKRKILQDDTIGMVKMEKLVLEKLDHPNIVKLHGTYQDPDYLYFVFELCPNGDLYEKLIKTGPLSLESVRFYTAEIVNALHYMYELGIIHRDIKPENILLSTTNQAKLADFGSAIIKPEVLEKTEKPKLIGTVEFMCPETINRQELSHAVDLWALGCTVYYLLTKEHAFKGESDYETMQNILARGIDFSEDFDATAKDFIERLLKLEPLERLGAGESGYEEVKSHAFFNGIDFNTLSESTPPN